MADTQRRLYDLGIFGQVDMAIQNPGRQEQRKYVIYDMDEAKKYSFDWASAPKSPVSAAARPASMCPEGHRL